MIWNCCPCWSKLKEFIHMVIMDPFTDLFLTICIILNIYFLALEYYPMSEETNNVLSTGNLVRLSLHVIFTCSLNISLVITIPIILFYICNMLQMHYMSIRWSVSSCISIPLPPGLFCRSSCPWIDLWLEFKICHLHLEFIASYFYLAVRLCGN